jgi:hypothetical protein
MKQYLGEKSLKQGNKNETECIKTKRATLLAASPWFVSQGSIGYLEDKP